MKSLKNRYRIVTVLMLAAMTVLCMTAASFAADDGTSSVKAVWNPEYKLTDINGNPVSTANPSNGTGKPAKYKILIFGRVGCINTRDTLRSISSSSWVSDSDIEVMFVEEGYATDEALQSFVDDCCCSDIIVCPTSGGYGGSMIWDYFEKWGGSGGSVSLPVIFMIDSNNLIRGVTTGYNTGVLDSCKRVCDAELTEMPDPEPVAEIMKIDFECGQSEARSMLPEMNARRTGSNGTEPWYWDKENSTKISAAGLAPLTYDYNLEKLAMQRAAEIAFSYSHTRPNGKDCFSIYYEFDNVGDAAGENIAAGYRSAEEVLDAWWEENEQYSGQGHRRNILASGSAYVGIGHVKAGGVDFWVQEFASTGSESNATPANDSKCTFDIEYFRDKIYSDVLSIPHDAFGENSYYSIYFSIGESFMLPEVTETIDYEGSSWSGCVVPNNTAWVVADSSVAEISGGRIIAKKAGSTKLSRAATYGGYPIEITVDVYDPNAEILDPSGEEYPYQDPEGDTGDYGNTGDNGDTGFQGDDAESGEVFMVSDIGGLSISLERVKYTYNGKYRKPSVQIYDGNMQLTKGVDYTVKYKNNKKVGSAKVTITGKGEYTGTVTKNFRIVPKKTSIKSLKPMKKGFIVKWKKQKIQTTGYQVRYSHKSNMSKAKTVTVKNNKTVSKTIRSLKSKKRYYVQVRTYKAVNGKKYYSAWSAKRKVKTK